MSLKQEIQTHLTDGTFVQWLPQGASDLASEIRQHLPQADEVQAEQFARQVIRLQGVEHFLEARGKKSDLDEETSRSLTKAIKELDYQRVYRIALLGEARKGKSLLINAMLADNYLLSRGGENATSTIVEVIFDANNGLDRAEVIPRHAEDICKLIEEFINSYQLENHTPPHELKYAFSRHLLTWQLNPYLAQVPKVSQQFSKDRQAIAELVELYAKGTRYNSKQEFSLPSELDQLKELMDNKNKDPRVRLISRIVYHLTPSREQTTVQRPLTLPHNVCLVDLPGIGGPRMHDLLIRQGIEEADVLIFMVAATGTTILHDDSLKRSIREYFGTSTVERIFFVLNQWDWVEDEAEADEMMQKVMQEFAPGYIAHPNLAKRGGNQFYFKVSAVMAYLAQRALETGHLERYNTKDWQADYDAFAAKEGVPTHHYHSPSYHQAVLKASNVPMLASTLMNFVSERRISQQIDEGKSLVNEVVRNLIEKYKADLYRELDARHFSYERKPGVPQLDELLKTLEGQDVHRGLALLEKSQEDLKEFVRQFHKSHREKLKLFNDQLKAEVTTIKNGLKTALLPKMPEFWQESVVSRTVTDDFGKVRHLFFQPLISQVETFLWDELTQSLKRLVHPLVNEYKQDLITYRVEEQILQSGLQQAATQEAVARLQQLIETMRDNLLQFSKRVALVYILPPSARLSNRYVLPPSSQQEEDLGWQRNQQLIAELPNFDPSQKHGNQPREGDFQRFVNAILDIYTAPLEGSMWTLLHIYYYELICLYKELQNSIDHQFNTLNHQVHTNHTFRGQVLKEDAGWNEVQALIETLRYLTQLHHDSNT